MNMRKEVELVNFMFFCKHYRKLKFVKKMRKISRIFCKTLNLKLNIIGGGSDTSDGRTKHNIRLFSEGQRAQKPTTEKVKHNSESTHFLEVIFKSHCCW